MSKITNKEIKNAIRDLEQSSRKVTIQAIRETLGGGSFSTIAPLLKEWRREKSNNLSAPKEIQSLMAESADQIWTLAESAANKRFAGERLELTEKIEEMIADDDEKSKEIERLENEIIKLKDQVVDLETEIHNRPTDEDFSKMQEGLKTKIEVLEGMIKQFDVVAKTDKSS